MHVSLQDELLVTSEFKEVTDWIDLSGFRSSYVFRYLVHIASTI